MEIVLLSTTGLSVSTAVGIVAYKAIRPRFPVAVNCWFCNKNTRVPYGNRDRWDCPHCEQYNGFSLDGDYNKAIPAQYYECLNHPITAENKSPSPQSEDRSDILCEPCNRNQVLKLRQLADFVPDNEETYDAEVERYRRYLEHVYGLCGKCERAVDETISKQDNGLQRKIEQLHRRSEQHHDVSASDSFQTSFSGCAVCAPGHVHLLRYLVCLCIAALWFACVINLLHQSDVSSFRPPEGWLVVGHLQHLHSHALGLAILSFVITVLSIYLAGRESLSGSDGGCVMFWLFLMLVFSDAVKQRMHYSNLYLLQVAMATFTLLFALWSAFVPRYEEARRRIIKRRCDGNTSGVSSTTGTPNHSPEPSLAGDYSQSRPGYQAANDNLLDLEELETLSVGSPYKSNTNYIKAFGQFGDTRKFSTPATTHIPSLHSLGQPRPVLSPARFKYNPPLRNRFTSTSPTQRSSARPQVRFQAGPSHSWRSLGSLRGQNTTLFDLPSQSQVNSLSDDRASLFSEPREPTVMGTESTHSSSEARESSCPPVHTTVPDDDDLMQSTSVFGPVHAKKACCTYLLQACILGAGIAVVVAIVYNLPPGTLDMITDAARNWTRAVIL